MATRNAWPSKAAEAGIAPDGTTTAMLRLGDTKRPDRRPGRRVGVTSDYLVGCCPALAGATDLGH